MTFKDLKKTRKRALVIVAHPDDESLFMGGTMVEFSKWQWTILCVTDCDKRYNERRRRELSRACRIYNKNGSHLRPFMLGLVKQKGRFRKNEAGVKIKNFIDKFGPFDAVFTHDNKGDYGHKTHKLIHNAVKALKPRNLYNFSLFPSKCSQGISLRQESRHVKMMALNIYLKGSQKTNLSRLKKLVLRALNAETEWFHAYN